MAFAFVFMKNNKFVAHINITAKNLANNILNDLSEEERERWLPVFDENGDEAFTDKELVRKVWNSCVRHGYIEENLKNTRKVPRQS